MDARHLRPADEPEPDAFEIRDVEGGKSSGVTDYATMIHQFGEAMNRIGRLEAIVETLAERMEALQSGTIAQDGQGPDPLTPIETPNGPMHSTTTAAATGDLPLADPQHMRLQLNSLASQLAQAEDELRDLKGRRAHRRRRGQLPRPMWKRALRKLGFK